MTFTGAIKTCFSKYATFSGRAPKSEFWYFMLFLFLVSWAATILNSYLFGPEVLQQVHVKTVNGITQDPTTSIQRNYTGGMIGNICALVTLLPMLAVAARRLHDSSKSALRLLIPLLIFAVCILMQYFFTEARPVDISHLPKEVTDQFSETPMIPHVTNSLAVFGSIAVAFISVIILIVWLASRSTPGTNKFGPNPHEVPT